MLMLLYVSPPQKTTDPSGTVKQWALAFFISIGRIGSWTSTVSAPGASQAQGEDLVLYP